MWVDTTWTLKELHHNVFEYLRQTFVEWIKQNESGEKKNSPDFPYQLFEDSKITSEEIKNMPVEKVFELCFPGIVGEKIEQTAESFDLKDMPYKLSFKSIRNFSNYKCYFCEQGMCDDCLVPYSEKVTVKDVLEQLKIEENSSLYDKFQSYSRNEDL